MRATSLNFAVRIRHPADLIAVAVLSITMLWTVRDLVFNPVRVGLDTVSFFWPAYAFLGDQLRQGNIPGWNPYQFGGVPFAADAESGWMYLPVMAVFGFLQLTVAIKVYATLHVLVAGFGTYAYGRVIGLVPAGALVAAWSVAQGGYFTDRSRCCYAHIQVVAWIPIVLLGLELAFRSSRSQTRLRWWILCGFATSQILAGWVGQGGMYALLMVAAYVAYRTLLRPDHSPLLRTRLINACWHGLVPLAIGLGLAAPGLIPRVEYKSTTNLAGGYDGAAAWAADTGGWMVGKQLEVLLTPSGWWLGAATLILAISGAVIGIRTRCGPFYAVLTLGTFVLGLGINTPLHWLLFQVIPGFETLHSHFPERIALIMVFGPAVLAGVAVTELWSNPPHRELMFALGMTIVGFAMIRIGGLTIPASTWRIAIAVSVGLVLVIVAARLDRPVWVRSATVLVVAVVLLDISSATSTSNRTGTFLRLQPDDIGTPNATAEFMLQQSPIYPVRYFGYDPSLSTVNDGEVTYYRHNFRDPQVSELLVNNQGTLWGVGDAQGYNPLQLQTFVDFIAEVNGASQEYHGAYILAGGLASPLLRLLAIEFIVVPLVIPAGRTDLTDLVAMYPESVRTNSVRILRVTDSLPRTWIVHDTMRVPWDQVIPALSSATLDFRTTAVVADDTPRIPIGPLGSGAQDMSAITAWSPDHLSISTSTQSGGLLVVSEIYADGWTATVDGQSTDLIQVNGILRGVTVTAGTHQVEMVFRTPGYRTGNAIGTVTIGVIALAYIFAARKDRMVTTDSVDEPARSG